MIHSMMLQAFDDSFIESGHAVLFFFSFLTLNFDSCMIQAAYQAFFVPATVNV